MKRIFTQDHRKKIGKSKIIYLTGKRFGKLVVLKHIKRKIEWFNYMEMFMRLWK